jgi:hypothetical protein
MDLLFKRYSSPYTIIEEVLKCGRFSEFATEFLKIHNEEVENETMWDWYLHHTFLDKTFEDFKKLLGVSKKPEPQERIDFGATFNNSMTMLEGFVPE